MPTMAPFSFAEDRDHVSLRSGSWVDGSCLTRVECLRDGGCSSNAVELYRGPLIDEKDLFSLLRSSPPISITPVETAKSKRRVTFDTKIQVSEIPHIKDMSVDEKVDIWWTAKDYMLIRKMLRITLQMIAKGNEVTTADEDFCTRGLDIHTIRGSRRHQKTRTQSVKSVLRAQDFQRAEGFNDAAYIAELYAQCSRSSYERALANAAVDAQESQRIS